MSLFHSLLAIGGQVPTPPSFDTLEYLFSAATRANVNTRQVDLEPSVAGVDRARSWSMWVLADNRSMGDQRVFGVARNTDGVQQYSFFLNSQTAATNNQKCGFTIFADSTGTNFIQIISSKRLLKARWYHVVITYSGSETAAGLKIYFNGAEDTSATKALTGSYSGAFNDTNLRFQTSSVFFASRSFGGIQRDLCIWNSELSSADVAVLYNNNVPFDVNTVSFYATGIVAYWPQHTSLGCLNNATFNLINSNGISVRSSPMSTTFPVISFFNGVVPNTKYLGFGGLYVKDGKVRYYTRQGTDHLLDGDMVGGEFDPSDLTAASPVTTPTIVFSDTSDLRGVSPAEIAGSVYLFNSRTNNGLNTYIDSDYWVSTDGDVGMTFGARNQLEAAVAGTSENFYGKVIQGNAAGEWLAPYYEYTFASGNSVVSLWRTLDNGATWNKLVVKNVAASHYTETAVLNCGGGRYLFIMRREAAGGGKLLAFTSTDNLATFSAVVDTGLVSGTGLAMADMALDPNGNITLVWFDRTAKFLGVSHSNPIVDVFADLTDWKNVSQPWRTDPAATLALGYPNIVYVDGYSLCIAVSSEIGAGSTRSDLFFCYGQFGTL